MISDLHIKCERNGAIYRFWRRYLMAYNPDLLKKISVEGMTTAQIQKLENKLIKFNEKTKTYEPNI